MAVIVITKTLPAICSVFNPYSFEFRITSGHLPKIELIYYGTTHEFIPFKTRTESGNDYYIFDCIDIFKFLLGVPKYKLDDMSLLSGYVEIFISYFATPTRTIETTLTYAYESGGLNYLTNLLTTGRLQTNLYINSNYIGFYFNGISGTYGLTIGGSPSQSVNLTTGYNFINLDNNTENRSGALVLSSAWSPNINIVYTERSKSGDAVTWLDDSGALSYYKFDEIENSFNVKQSNNINIYNNDKASFTAIDRMISAEKMQTVKLYTIAVDIEHYAQLLKIADSLVINYKGVYWSVADISKSLSFQKQNLRFELTLERKDYVPTF